MIQALVITVVGPDRPGIVGSLADVVASHEGDWLESQFANIAGQFAGMVRIDVAEARRDDLVAALSALENEALAVSVAAADADFHTTIADDPHSKLTLALTGLDHPGIVRDIGQALDSLGVSIETLESDRQSGSMSGEMMFTAKATLAVPEPITFDQVDSALEKVSAGLMVDLMSDDVDAG